MGCKDRILSFNIQRDGKSIFYFADDKDAMQGSDAVQVSESAENKFLIILHASCVDLQLVVIFSGGVEALHNLVDVGNDGGELTAEFLAVMLQSDVAENHDAITCLDRVDYGDVFLYISFPFEAFLSFEHRRWGQVHFGCKLLLRGGFFSMRVP